MKKGIILIGVLIGGWFMMNILSYPVAIALKSNRNPTKSTKQNLTEIQKAIANLKPSSPSPIPQMPPGKPGLLPEKEKIVQLSDQNWQTEVLQSKRPVLVLFFASWSPPASKQKEEFEGLRERYAGQLKLGVLDCEKNARACGKLKVQGIPSLRLYDRGKMVGQLKELTKKEAMTQWIKKTFKKDS
jgi:thioredoxin 1